ncbi:MAG: calcium/sodium antiporter [Acidimicrobiia bacterium]|nr:calcium/sodium antiporter [Acidimicrobiia bacterium]MDH5521359.1 calcium/sodium antiporter [Acidimicrobiia bacterium]
MFEPFDEVPGAVFLVGLAGLLVAGHLLVSGSVLLGRRFGLSSTVIGLTIVAAGTSAPELAVFARAVQVNDTELAVGSVVGSNIANVLLVLGLVAALGTVRLASRVVRIDVPVMIGASLLLLIFAADGLVGPFEAAVLFAAAVAFVVFTVRSSGSDDGDSSAAVARAEGGAFAEADTAIPQLDTGVAKGLVLVAVGAVGLAFAADYVVSGAERIAAGLGVPELIVGLTVVALGTSAPEIVTSIVSAFRGERDLAVGNALGSNIFNILFVIGLSGLFARPGITLSPEVVAVDLPIMVAVAVACLPLLLWDHKLDRWEGLVFLAYYAAYTGFLVLTATDHGATETFVTAMVWFVMPLTVLTVATVLYRGRKGRRRPGPLRSAIGSSSLMAGSPSAVVPDRSGPKEVPMCSPPRVNPLLLKWPSTKDSSTSRNATATGGIVYRRPRLTGSARR